MPKTSIFLKNNSKQLLSSAQLVVDVEALKANYLHIHRLAPSAQIAPVLKADAYGAGIQGVALALWEVGARQFFVATAEEGVELRSLLPQAVIYLLNGLMGGEKELLLTHNFIPVLFSYEMAQELALFAKKKGRSFEVALQFNTGLMRLGLREKEASSFLKGGEFEPFLKVIHILTQFASSSILNHPQNAEQEKAFASVAVLFPTQIKSFASSGGLSQKFSTFYDMVRPGISLYGICPGRRIEELQQVVTLQAPVLQILEGHAGEKVGYDGTYVLERPSRLATLGFGYADGYPTVLMNKGYVCIEGYKAPVRGRISMDLMTVDVTNIPENILYPGMPAILWGKDPKIEDVASLSHIITNALLTGLGRRVQRVYV